MAQRKATWKDLSSARVQTIIEMANEGATDPEIGRKLGITGDRVWQLRQKIEEYHGEQVFGTRKSLYTTKQVASAAGMSPQTLHKWAKNGRVPCYAFNPVRFTAVQMHAICAYRRALPFKCCKICGKGFVDRSKRMDRPTCPSKECWYVHRNRARMESYWRCKSRNNGSA